MSVTKRLKYIAQAVNSIGSGVDDIYSSDTFRTENCQDNNKRAEK